MDDPNHSRYEVYNDMEIVLFYDAMENYENGYAFFWTSENAWEFAPGGAWIWFEGDCGGEGDYDGAEDPCNMGYMDADRDDFEYEFEFEEWGDEYFWECGSHEECGE